MAPMNDSPAAPATCLGCGCLCDDIEPTVDGGRIVRLKNACRLGERWFGDGTFPAEVLIAGRPAAFDDALSEAARLLFADPGRLLIYVGDDLTCEAHREAAALADRTGATIDGPTSDTVAEGLLAAQRRGRATATLGELRHRADTVLFWGVDPAQRYPRFLERFVRSPALFATPRRLVAIDVADRRGPAECTERLPIDAAEEVDALGVMRATVLGHRVGELSPTLRQAAVLARRLASESKYVAIVFDAEPTSPTDRDEGRTEGLIALLQSLNGPTRAAGFGLRAGGNRNGLESVLTWQTGYPFSVDFATGYPTYAAGETAAERLVRGRFTAALVLGSPAMIPDGVAARLSSLPTVAIGPRASQAPFAPRVAIDTGAASLHEAGLVLRMDDVPIHASRVLTHPRSATDVLRALSSLLPARALAEVG